jgi:hypothetical protein
MSFRRRTNRHDAWIRHRDESAALLREIGLPAAVCESEQTLAEFLTTGHRADLALDLDALPERQFWRLFDFASSWFDHETADFTALERRRLRGDGNSADG